MPLTPAEIRHSELQRRPFGYRTGQVDQLLKDVVESFEEVWRDRADLAEQVEHLQGELQRHRELETLLRTTLVSAERAAQDQKDQARRESDVLLEEARAEARAITRSAVSERERLLGDCHRLRALLRSALVTLEHADEVQTPARAA